VSAHNGVALDGGSVMGSGIAPNGDDYFMAASCHYVGGEPPADCTGGGDGGEDCLSEEVESIAPATPELEQDLGGCGEGPGQIPPWSSLDELPGAIAVPAGGWAVEYVGASAAAVEGLAFAVDGVTLWVGESVDDGVVAAEHLAHGLLGLVIRDGEALSGSVTLEVLADGEVIERRALEIYTTEVTAGMGLGDSVTELKLAVGDAGSMRILVENTGASPLYCPALAVDAPLDAEMVSSLPARLAPGERASVALSFEAGRGVGSGRWPVTLSVGADSPAGEVEAEREGELILDRLVRVRGAERMVNRAGSRAVVRGMDPDGEAVHFTAVRLPEGVTLTDSGRGFATLTLTSVLTGAEGESVEVVVGAWAGEDEEAAVVTEHALTVQLRAAH